MAPLVCIEVVFRAPVTRCVHDY